MILKKILKKIKSIHAKVFNNFFLFIKYYRVRKTIKIWLILTPPNNLRNIGDHAQVIGVKKWLNKHYSNYRVIEIDKNEIMWSLKIIKFLARDEDLIFLHSGGNLGDRGMWSERGRRLVISNFINNKIVSLPQTIYFSPTRKGDLEKIISKDIYSKHPNLTIIARDKTSSNIARELFVKAKVLTIPDFVLTLQTINDSKKKHELKKGLFILRQDNESIISANDIERILAKIPYDISFFDTTINQSISRNMREIHLNRALNLISNFDFVVTDRFHGLIFSILCCKPTVVLNTVDHKLDSSIEWFNEIEFVTFTNIFQEVPNLIEEILLITNYNTKNWNKLYFDNLSKLI
jgi:pyruvyl transferase EpsI